jgi:gluconolactonase
MTVRAWRDRLVRQLTIILVLATATVAQTPSPKPTASIAPRIAGVVAQGTPVELLATDLAGSEGPVAAPDGSLLFTAGPAILKVDGSGKISPYLTDAAGMTLCCGLGFDANGRLIAARTDPAQILVLEPERRVLLEAFDSQPLLRPNDLTIAKNGGKILPR